MALSSLSALVTGAPLTVSPGCADVAPDHDNRLLPPIQLGCAGECRISGPALSSSILTRRDAAQGMARCDGKATSAEEIRRLVNSDDAQEQPHLNNRIVKCRWGVAVSYPLRAGIVAVAVLASFLATGSAQAQLHPPREPQPDPSSLLTKVQGAVSQLKYWHDVVDDIAPDYVYCNGWALLRRILAEARDTNTDPATRFFGLLAADALADELGEDDFLQYEYYEDEEETDFSHYDHELYCALEVEGLAWWPIDKVASGHFGGPTFVATVDFVDQHSTWTIT